MVDGVSIFRFPTVVVAVDRASGGQPVFGIIDQTKNRGVAECAIAEFGPASFYG